MDDESLQGGYWKQSLYLLQEKAPKPSAVQCKYNLVENKPHFYGLEFHGLIERSDAKKVWFLYFGYHFLLFYNKYFRS